MIKKHTLKSFFVNFLRNAPPDYAEDIGANIILATSSPKWKDFLPSSEIRACIQESLPEMSSEAEMKLETTSIWRHAGKSFSNFAEHRGNSYVEFTHNGQSLTGVIQYIIRPHGHTAPIFLIHGFRELNSTDSSHSPYQSLPHLKARVVYNEASLMSVRTQDIYGHCAAIHNRSGTFGIHKPTVSLVSLRSMLCFQGISDITSSYEPTS
ncbi:uncharacterized protein MELLADRAFT_70170 [Melampsora larici-populina 98AG31]|uniref:Uncharacterized protein n=1 Tax=Melampsora larici-populina (strain 98AG31 / pathotype 3-4-7) TaxID=747676 RepID=F4SDW2_MELLP|nr:uncharacterized protein MELLADRAFT_70170 [Melampsora larici-populina 98AG31]EGF97165.1 hypothetical protein MELLADRAFT_70170 [Melampsora larici-populina 98AG31]